MKHSIVTLILCSFALTGLTAQKKAIVGTVDFPRLLSEYDAYKKAVEQAKAEEEVAQKEIGRLKEKLGLVEVEQRIRQLRQKALNPAIADEERKAAGTEGEQLLRDSATKIQQFNAFSQQLEEKSQQDRLRILNPFQLKAREAVIAVAQDKGLHMVLPLVPREIKIQAADDTETIYNVFEGPVLYASEDLDITDAVIAVLNAQ